MTSKNTETQFSPTRALSLARTALDDPEGLPESEYAILQAPYTGNGDGGTYAIDKIDQVMGALEYNGGSGNDNQAEASWVLENLQRLLETFVYDMGEELNYQDHEDASRLHYAGLARRAAAAVVALQS